MRDKIPAADGSAEQPGVNPEGANSLAGDGVTPVSRASRGLKIVLIGALAVIVVLGVFVAFLMMRAPDATPQTASQSASEPEHPAAAIETPTPTPTPTTELGQGTAQEPAAPQAPAPAPPAPAPAPPAPAPPAPAPATPPITPLKVTAMDAVVSGACTTKSTILLTWTTVGATADSTSINVRTGGGTPVVKATWINMPASGYYSFFNLDCTRPIWYFKMTITNGTETKEALLTFANGKTAGWSSVAN